MAISNEQYISQYLQRIGYTGDTQPSLATLQALQQHHLYSIPFENIDLLGECFVPNIDRDALFDKLVARRRGGVCYELNTSFYHLLCALGFSACQISGRCMLDGPLTGHVFTLVHLPEGDYTADVGFGDDAVPPLNINSREKVHAYHTDCWLEDDTDGLLRLYLQRPGQEPAFQYQFALTVRTPEEIINTFRFTAAPGNTFFSERHICCRFTPEGKILLRRGILSIEEYNQIVLSQTITPGSETDACLRKYFDLP